MSASGSTGNAGRLFSRDVLAGIFFCGIAVLGFWIAQDYPPGSAMRIGTGAFPRILCGLLFLLGLAVGIGGLRRPAPARRDPAAWRPIFFVLLSIVLFGLFIETLGMVLGVAMLMGVASLGGTERHPVELVLFIASISAIAVALFVWGVGLPIPVWPG